ncbi:ATP-dependent RNA helicase DED1 [Gaeumannomyces tritici R3-111a-1]|uniref:RNA helicase n=1 Tax=Gaeumannomyces tritici (strain R3-111a-1) TaxID=644352 RepID=J3PDM7_GAET3|nr:ATP-dependent RNA helicase DED1 [Gaeumannomyces tritici R3-111a-1]EJT70577.1 ATP-dependent RNA helicase DED1 [Gaeumannomyces tritici R3-111a-1]
MSGWETSNEPGTQQGVQAHDAFGVSQMAADLPETGKAPTEPEPQTLESQGGWVDRTAYDYGNEERNHTWEGDARIYEWDGEEGDLGPEVPQLEDELFGPKNKDQGSAGIDFSTIASIDLVQEGPVRVAPALKFQDAGLHPAMLKNIELCGYKTPTPIQSYCLPAIHKGYDVIGIAQTGSGKTAAFLIPIINKLMGKAKKLAAPRPNPATYNFDIHGPIRAEPLVLLICPTRELAIQIFNEARKLCYRSMLRPGVVYGGGPFGAQVRQIGKGCDILCATPGRLIHFMERPELLTLRRLKYMVIDEADEILHDDWTEDLEKILSGGEQEEGNINYLLFSATFPKKIRDLAKTHLSETHVRFRVGRAGSTHANIIQSVVETAPFNKRQALTDLLNSLPPQRTIIFVNSKQKADELDDYLYNQARLPVTSMHADRTQREREDALRAFRKGTTPIMVATGISARGIDVRNVAHVINYDLPSMEHGGIEEYTHRIGRTGRIGHKGMATSFFTDRDEPLGSVLVRTMLETQQEIPEFLAHHIPEGEARENLKFEADSDFEQENDNGGGDAGGGWGATNDDNANSGGGWGADAEEKSAPQDAKEKTQGGWGSTGTGW